MPDAAQVLDDIKGVGQSTRDALLARYDSLAELALASEEQLTEVKGVGPATAERIRAAVAEALEAEASAEVADAQETTPDDAVAVATSTSESPAEEEVTGEQAEAEATTQAPPEAPVEAPEAELPAAGETTPAEATAATAARPDEGPAREPGTKRDVATSRERTYPRAGDRPGTATQRTRDEDPKQRVAADVQETVQSIRDAGLALSGVVIAAITAGRKQLPRVAENLKEARSSATQTATDLVLVVKRIRKRR